jgi:hypothetical protein
LRAAVSNTHPVLYSGEVIALAGRKLATDTDHFSATMGIFPSNAGINSVPSNRPSMTLLRSGLSGASADWRHEAK